MPPRLLFRPILKLLFTFGFMATRLVAAESSPTNGATVTSSAVPRVYPLTAFSAIGSSFAQRSRLSELGWEEQQIEAFIEGVRAALHGKPYAFDDTAREMSAEMSKRLQATAARDKLPVGLTSEQIAQSMKELRKRFQLQITDSGMGVAIRPGRSGVRPRPGDTVEVSCVVTAADGTTKLPQLGGEHVRMKLADLLPGMMEGLQMMTVGSEGILVLPPALSFGEGAWPAGVERGTLLVFFFTLHAVNSPDTSP